MILSNNFKEETKNLNVKKKVDDFPLESRKILYGTCDSIFVAYAKPSSFTFKIFA